MTLVSARKEILQRNGAGAGDENIWSSSLSPETTRTRWLCQADNNRGGAARMALQGQHCKGVRAGYDAGRMAQQDKAGAGV